MLNVARSFLVFASKVYVMALMFLYPFNSFSASGITYHGRLMKPDGTAVTSSSVQFRLQLRTPGAEDCLLYDELQNIDLSATKGIFSVSLGDGTGLRQDSNAWGLFEALSNRKSFSFSASDCNGGPSSFTPTANSNRSFRVLFNDGTFAGWEGLPIQTLNFIPMSIESYAVGGFPASSLLRVEDAGTLGTPSALTTAQYNEILALVGGTSSLFEKAGQLNGSSIPAVASGNSLQWNGSAWTAITPLTSESDPTVSAFAKASLPTCGAGEVLKSDGTSLTCVTDTTGGAPADATDTVKGIANFPAAGGLSVASGAVSLPDVATAGTSTKVTYDAKGRVTSGTTLAESDIPTLSAAGKVSGSALTSGTIAGSTAVSTSGNIGTTGNISATGSVTSGSMSTRAIDLYDSDNTNYIRFQTPATGVLTSDYNLTFPSTLGTANQVLGMNSGGTALENKSIVAGSGVTINHTANSIEIVASGSGGTVTSVSGTSPISVATGTSTPVISIADTAVTPGSYGSATQVATFTVDQKGRLTAAGNTTVSGVSPVGSSLTDTNIWVGDGSNQASAVSMSGDATLANTGALTLATSGVTAGSYGSATQVPTYTVDAKGRVTASSNTTITGVSPVGSSLTDAQMFVGNGSNQVAAVAMSGDATLANTGALSLSTTGVSAGTYKSLTVDTKGRVTAGTNPTTLSGYGITDAVQNAGGTVSFQSGVDASLPAAGTAGAVYIATDTKKIYRDNGVTWDTVASNAGTGIASLGGQTGGTQTFAIGTSGLAPAFSSATNTHTLNIPMASTTSVTAGLLSKSDYDTFNSKLSAVAGSSLTDTNIWVGNGSNVAAAVSMSGDATLANTGAISVTKIRGTSVNSSAPTVAGQVLKYNGTTEYVATYFGVSDLKNALGNAQFPASCTAAQTLVYSAVTDVYTCSSIAIANTAVSGLGTASTKDFGTSSGNLVELDGGGKIPASLIPTSTSGDILNGGNTTAATVVIGTNDAQSLQLETNNSPAMTILSGGNVGIGTTTPSGRLDIEGGDVFIGTGTLTNASAADDLNVTGNVEAAAFYGDGSNLTGISASPAGADGQLQYNNGGSLGGDAKLVWDDTNGEFEVGDANFKLKLASGVEPNIYMDTNDWMKYNRTTNTYDWVIGSGLKMSLNSSGLGVGVAAPTGALEVQGDVEFYNGLNVGFSSGSTSNDRVAIGDGTFYLNNNSGLAPGITFDTGDWMEFNRTSNYLRWIIGSSERMRLDSSGNVGIGTTVPAVKLDVAGGVKIGNQTTCTATEEGTLRYNSTTKGMEFCNGSSWASVGSTGGSGGLRSCDTGNPSDVMVPVGSWCVDKYEASVWSASSGSGTQYFHDGATTDFNYPDAGRLPADFNRDGSGSSVVYAVSKPNVLPARGITWYQAAVVCANSGKQLIPDSLWQTAALGTVDPGAGSGTGGLNGGSAADHANAQCNINTQGANNDVDGDSIWSDSNNKIRLTAKAGSTSGGTNACMSRFGVEDMVGNVWEWTDMNGAQAGADQTAFTQGESNTSGGPFSTADGTWNINGSAYGCDGPGTTKGTCGWKDNTPAAALRGVVS